MIVWDQFKVHISKLNEEAFKQNEYKISCYFKKLYKSIIIHGSVNKPFKNFIWEERNNWMTK